jgi:hypothetical protein
MAGHDDLIRDFVEHVITSKQFNYKDTEEARKIIEQAALILSKRDRSLLEKGLHQPSKVGEGRYVKDLVSL